MRIYIVALLLLVAGTGFSQEKDTLIKKLDSLSIKTDSAGGQKNNITPEAYNEDTRMGFNSYFTLLFSDFKQQFTAPFHQKKKDWIKVAKFAAVTTALAFADEPMQHFAVKLTQNNPAVKEVSNYVTSFGGLYETYILSGLGAYGFIFKNDKIKTTTLLASQAYLTGGAMEYVIKTLAGRQRPNYSVYNQNAISPEPTFHGPFYKATDAEGKKLNSSFPSGHTTVAFAAATVFAMEYKNRPWIPITAYTVATLVGVSRITENKHWTTDVLCGAALGYLCGHQVVNNYHRYAKLKAPQQQHNSVSFNLKYWEGNLMPDIVYHFN